MLKVIQSLCGQVLMGKMCERQNACADIYQSLVFTGGSNSTIWFVLGGAA